MFPNREKIPYTKGTKSFIKNPSRYVFSKFDQIFGKKKHFFLNFNQKSLIVKKEGIHVKSLLG